MFAHELYCTEINSFKKYFEFSRKERKIEVLHLKKINTTHPLGTRVCVHVAVCIGIQTQNWTYYTLAISLHPEDTAFEEH